MIIIPLMNHIFTVEKPHNEDRALLKQVSKKAKPDLFAVERCRATLAGRPTLGWNSRSILRVDSKSKFIVNLSSAKQIMGKPKQKKDSYKPYLGNKKEGQGFADKRKKKAAYEYLKLLKKEKNSTTRSGDTDAPKHKPLEFLKSQIKSPQQGKKKHAFSAAEKIARKKQEEKQSKKR
ncbi:thyroid transcription factor 1-associated protein 26, partial [Plakobranchus ocellatus]